MQAGMARGVGRTRRLEWCSHGGGPTAGLRLVYGPACAQPMGSAASWGQPTRLARHQAAEGQADGDGGEGTHGEWWRSSQ